MPTPEAAGRSTRRGRARYVTRVTVTRVTVTRITVTGGTVTGGKHLQLLALIGLEHVRPVDHAALVVEVGLHVEHARDAALLHQPHVRARLRVGPDRQARRHLVVRQVGRHEVAVKRLPLSLPPRVVGVQIRQRQARAADARGAGGTGQLLDDAIRLALKHAGAFVRVDDAVAVVEPVDVLARRGKRQLPAPALDARQLL